jgi:uncharacterized protein YjgD (DUF1641 family)
MTDKILTHAQDALKRLLEQYKDANNIKNIINIYTTQIQEIEDILYDMFLNRSVQNGIGNQLDLIGYIVGAERQGWSDDIYKLVLFAKIGQNVSNGEPERIIDILKLLSQATIVHFMNLGNAEIELGTDGIIDSNLINFVFANLSESLAGAIRLNIISFFDKDEPFSFAGASTNPSEGFSSTSTPLIGGKFAYLKTYDLDFAFFGSDLDAAGFGTIVDSLIGGVF